MQVLIQRTTSTILPVLVACVLSGCGGGNSDSNSGTENASQKTRRQQFISMGTAPVGGAFAVVGGAIADSLNEYKDNNNWKVNAKGSKGSRQNIRLIDQGDFLLGLSNSAISYFAVRGESGWEKAYNIRSIATLAPNIAMFITKSDSGINTIGDLKGKRVVVGPSGAGFEMFVQPLLQAHDVTYADFNQLNAPQQGAVDLLADGNADAAFLGGAVPTGSITQACSSHDIFFVPFAPEARDQLSEQYPFFSPFTLPQNVYSDLTEDYQGLNVGSMHLITSADADEEQIYQITKTIWEHRADIKHPAAKFINEDNAARYTGTEFHPGSIRFYQEIGIWKDPENEQESESVPTS